MGDLHYIIVCAFMMITSLICCFESGTRYTCSRMGLRNWESVQAWLLYYAHTNCSIQCLYEEQVSISKVSWTKLLLRQTATLFLFKWKWRCSSTTTLKTTFSQISVTFYINRITTSFHSSKNNCKSLLVFFIFFSWVFWDSLMVFSPLFLSCFYC